MVKKRRSLGKALWIGLAEVEPISGNGVLGDVRGAFTNAIAMANGRRSFRVSVRQALEDLDLRLIRLKDAETLESRLRKHSISEDLARAAEEVKSTGGVGFGTFHTFGGHVEPSDADKEGTKVRSD